MRIVEFVGLPGVGKSTLYRALLRSRPIGRARYHSPQELLSCPRIALRALNHPQLKAAAARYPRLARLLYNARPPQAQRRAALSQMDERYMEFLRHCLTLDGRDFPWPAYQLMGLRWLARLIETYAVLDRIEEPERSTVLIEEGLAQKVHAIIPLSPQAEGRERRYFESMPTPAGIVHVAMAPAAVIERVKGRHAREVRMTLRHHHLDEAQLRRDLEGMARTFESGLRTLRSRGLAVLDVDATQPVSQGVERIDAYLRELTA